MDEKLREDIVQREIKPISGMLMCIVFIAVFIAGIALIVFSAIGLDSDEANIGNGIMMAVGIAIVTIVPCLMVGLKVVGPNEALVLTLFGNYYGTILKQGFYYVNPFVTYNNPAYTKAVASAKKSDEEGGKLGRNSSGIIKINAKKTVSLKSTTLNNGVQKVNDVMGNPIIIGAMVIWKVVDPTKAVFNVEDYTEFLSIQTDSTIRNIARVYPYDSITGEEHEGNEKTLRGSSQEIADNMKIELRKKVDFAGIEIEEVRITHLSYAEEIAAAMLRRQQAEAVISARAKIVDGAVSMVKMAIDKLGEEEVVVLDEERKAAMVSNLMVVLCSDKDTQPIVNSGSIY